MRTHITKSLQTRSKSIKQALASYNAAAAALTPPRPPLDWSEVGSYHFLEQFALLQNTRHDICNKRWTKSAVRACIKLRHRIRRAREEIDRLNIEVRRLHAAIQDESILFRQVRARLQAANNPLLAAVREYTERRERINSQLLVYVFQVYKLDGYTGVKGAGIRFGFIPPDGLARDDAPPDVVDDDEVLDAEVDILEGDEEQEALAHLVEFISAISIS
jgi:hypothetical protein